MQIKRAKKTKYIEFFSADVVFLHGGQKFNLFQIQSHIYLE